MSHRKKLSAPKIENLFSELGEIVSPQENAKVIKEDLESYTDFKANKRIPIKDVSGRRISAHLRRVISAYNDLDSFRDSSELGKKFNELMADFESINNSELINRDDKFIYAILDCLLFNLEKLTLYRYAIGLPDELSKEEEVAMYRLRGENNEVLKEKFEALQKFEDYSEEDIETVVSCQSLVDRIRNNSYNNPKRIAKLLSELRTSPPAKLERLNLKRKTVAAEQNEDSDNQSEESATVEEDVISEPPRSLDELLAELNVLNSSEKEAEAKLNVLTKKAKKAFSVIDEDAKAEQLKLEAATQELSGLMQEAAKFNDRANLILPGELEGISLPAGAEGAESSLTFYESYAFRAKCVADRKATQRELRGELKEKIALCRELVEQHKAHLAQWENVKQMRALLAENVNQTVDALRGSVNPSSFFGKKVSDMAQQGKRLKDNISANDARLKALDESIKRQEGHMLEQNAELDRILKILSEESNRESQTHRVAIDAVQQESKKLRGSN